MIKQQKELNPNEPHPAAEIARRYLLSDKIDLLMLEVALAASATPDNRMAHICSETLRRIIAKEPVSDRYFMGLAWLAWSLYDGANDLEVVG